MPVTSMLAMASPPGAFMMHSMATVVVTRGASSMRSVSLAVKGCSTRPLIVTSQVSKTSMSSSSPA